MTHDREHKVHKLLAVADLFERDPEMRALFADMDVDEEWFASKARLMRDLAQSLADSAANTQ